MGSRRQIEAWIVEGRVRVGREVAHLGQRVLPNADIFVDGRKIHVPKSTDKIRVILYYKPEGIICTRRDDKSRPTVFDTLAPIRRGRWVMVGRLDLNTSGLLLFTNQGELADRLMHPRNQVEREYAVRVLGAVAPLTLELLQKGVNLEDGTARFLKLEDAGGEGANHWYHVVVNEGRNRLVRRLWESQGVRVSRLIRIRMGDLQLPRSLKVGQWKELSLEEIRLLDVDTESHFKAPKTRSAKPRRDS